MVQGLAICNVAASFVSNTSALQAQGCSPPSSNIPSDYCTALTGLNAPNLLNETYK